MQADLVSAPHTGNQCIFLSGPPGAGKTSLAVQRLFHLLGQGIPAEQILILVPQRTLATPYYQALGSAQAPAGGQVDVATIGGLARRTLDLFWPLVAEAAGFGQAESRSRSGADHPPRFLTLETAQYYMDRVAEPFITGGAFDGITISRARLVSQVIDNLNKAAAVGFPVDQIAARLKGAWSGESARLRIYDQVQAVALAFRRACLAQNLLDWSLQIEVFWHHLLPLPQLRRYLLGGYRHLIVDNTEEDIPVTHDLLRVWLPLCESALVIHDTDGGYRVFLGADPKGALALADLCRQRVLLAESHVSRAEVAALGAELAAPFVPKISRPPRDGFGTSPRDGFGTPPRNDIGASQHWGKPQAALRFEVRRFHTQMLDWVAGEISRLVLEEGLPPGEIAVLAPFLSDALRFSLAEKLDRYNIPIRSHRPSRELREEPAARCLLTLAKLAHPAWRRPPPAADVAHALALSIADLDPVRARLLADIVYRVRDGQPTLTPFHQLVPETQMRISYLLGGRYDELWRWIQEYVGRTEGMEGNEGAEGAERLDHFMSRLFGEVLSQPGFGFHCDLNGGAVAANLIESVQKFRQAYSPLPPEGEQDTPRLQGVGGPGPVPSEAVGVVGAGLPRPYPRPEEVRGDLGLEYLDMVERGVLAAQYVSSWQIRPEEAVLLVPAYTFLMMNQPVTVQFWLDAGSRAWFERIYQPLTHPYVLRRDWPEEDTWTDEDEMRTQQEALGRLILGLARRCRQQIYLAFSELNERGYEQQGPLQQAVQRLLRRLGKEQSPEAVPGQGPEAVPGRVP